MALSPLQTIVLHASQMLYYFLWGTSCSQSMLSRALFPRQVSLEQLCV